MVNLIVLIEEDAVVVVADHLDLLHQEDKVLVSHPPHQQWLLHPLQVHLALQYSEQF